ncbi:hypothetical protein NMY22_g7736 [Coprinellus aureogranulatus]|nr:hypothetical protein NMY22_g7736 [Coprinellus aureogranulatus]
MRLQSSSGGGLNGEILPLRSPGRENSVGMVKEQGKEVLDAGARSSPSPNNPGPSSLAFTSTSIIIAIQSQPSELLSAAIDYPKTGKIGCPRYEFTAIPFERAAAVYALFGGMVALTTPAQRDLDARICALEKEIVELKRSRNDLSPISRVPAEILCEILLAATGPLITERELRTDGYMKTLCFVCHTWRKIALACPQLWAEIDLRIVTDTSQLQFLIEHAHPLPLSICIKQNFQSRPVTGSCDQKRHPAIQHVKMMTVRTGITR